MGGQFIIHNLLRKKIFVSIALFIFVFCFIAFIYKFFIAPKNKAAEEALKIVEVEEISVHNIQQTVRLIGTIRPKHATVLVAKGSGMLDSLVSTGQKIQKGALIAKIDNPDMEKNHQLSESAEKIAKIQYDRLSNLLKTGIVSAKEAEEKKQAWIEALKNLSNTKIELDTMRFYAPFDGIIGAYKKREGTQVTQGDPVVTIYDPSALTVDFDIPCTTITSINEGQSVQVLQRAYPLTHMQKMIDEESHMCPADVDIVCDSCVIGSSVDVDLVTEEKKQVIVVPYQSIFLRNGQPFVYVVEKNKIVLVPVKTGLQDKSRIEITSGLSVGQMLVIKGQERLYPEMQVRINKPSSAPATT